MSGSAAIKPEAKESPLGLFKSQQGTLMHWQKVITNKGKLVLLFQSPDLITWPIKKTSATNDLARKINNPRGSEKPPSELSTTSLTLHATLSTIKCPADKKYLAFVMDPKILETSEAELIQKISKIMFGDASFFTPENLDTIATCTDPNVKYLDEIIDSNLTRQAGAQKAAQAKKDKKLGSPASAGGGGSGGGGGSSAGAGGGGSTPSVPIKAPMPQTQKPPLVTTLGVAAPVAPAVTTAPLGMPPQAKAAPASASASASASAGGGGGSAGASDSGGGSSSQSKKRQRPAEAVETGDLTGPASGSPELMSMAPIVDGDTEEPRHKYTVIMNSEGNIQLVVRETDTAPAAGSPGLEVPSTGGVVASNALAFFDPEKEKETDEYLASLVSVP